MKPRMLLLLLSFTASAQAANLVVPAARPLVITNHEAEAAPVTVTFYSADSRSEEEMLLAGSGTIDVPADATMVRISSAQQMTAHAANLPAIAVDALATEHVLSGSIVVANPWKVPASLVVTSGDQQLFPIVPPLDVLRIDVGESARITSQVGVYAYGERSYGSVVQAASAVEPRCAEPAALSLAKQPAGGWLVILHPESSVEWMQVTLPARHGYMPLQFYAELPGFLAELTAEQIAALRCEASVQLIAQNAAAH